MKAHAITIIAAVAALSLPFLVGAPITGAVTERRVAQPGDFELTLTPEKVVCPVGTAPQVRAHIVNQSGTEVLLVPALDGSDMGRYPNVRFEVTRPKNAPEPERFGRCGNTNNITPEDFVRVPDGKTFDPVGDWGKLNSRLFNAPGVYTVKLIYDTRAEVERWHGFMGPLANKGAIARLHGEVPSMRLESKIVEVTVVEGNLPE